MSATPSSQRPGIRLWPGVFIIALMWVGIIVPKNIDPGGQMMVWGMFFGPMIAGGLIVLWWLFLSRIPWLDRIVGLLVFVAAGVATFFLCHPSFKMAFAIY